MKAMKCEYTKVRLITGSRPVVYACTDNGACGDPYFQWQMPLQAGDLIICLGHLKRCLVLIPPPADDGQSATHSEVLVCGTVFVLRPNSQGKVQVISEDTSLDTQPTFLGRRYPKKCWKVPMRIHRPSKWIDLCIQFPLPAPEEGKIIRVC